MAWPAWSELFKSKYGNYYIQVRVYIDNRRINNNDTD